MNFQDINSKNNFGKVLVILPLVGQPQPHPLNSQYSWQQVSTTTYFSLSHIDIQSLPTSSNYLCNCWPCTLVVTVVRLLFCKLFITYMLKQTIRLQLSQIRFGTSGVWTHNLLIVGQARCQLCHCNINNRMSLDVLTRSESKKQVFPCVFKDLPT